MNRDAHIPVYTTERVETYIESQADAADQSVSTYCHEVLKEHVESDMDANQQARYGTDTDIELLITELQSELRSLLDSFITETGAEIHHLQSLRTAYAIAIWELIKDDYSPAEREVALKTAGKHVEKQTLTSGQQPETESNTGQSPDQNDAQLSPSAPSQEDSQ